MTEPVMLAIIGGVVTILVAYMEKMRRDVKSTRIDSAAVHASINNRTDKDGKPIPLSDRMDQLATKDDLAAMAITVQSIFEKERGLRGIVAAQGRRLNDHIEATAPMLPMLEDLHARYAGTKGVSDDSTA